MADRNLEQIIADLRKQRELLRRLLDDPSMTAEEREKLLEAAERLRDGLNGKDAQ